MQPEPAARVGGASLQLFPVAIAEHQLGAAFRRISYDESETELLIMVTPELAGPITDGCLPPTVGGNTTTPTDRELFGSGYLEQRKYAPDPDEGMMMPGMGGPGLIGPNMGPNCAPQSGMPPAVPTRR